ncbi:hypothetical protein [Streptomyces sp. NPDC047990]|uniref:hypothetical protein n=1 Tax=Streptomyces sp. NPDC047990 TaxID=3365496 RepID=UPI0037170689
MRLGAGALVAAYRRRRVDEDGALRDATHLSTERFTTAVSQLGDSAPAVRLGGVHALAGLADDAPAQALRHKVRSAAKCKERSPATALRRFPCVIQPRAVPASSPPSSPGSTRNFTASLDASVVPALKSFEERAHPCTMSSEAADRPASSCFA